MNDTLNMAALLAIEEIKQLKARYFRCMDTKDWAGLEQVFSPDCRFDMRGESHDDSKSAEGLVIGAPAIAAFMRRAVEDLVTVHHGHMPEIELTGPDAARGLWAMEDLLWWPPGGALKTLRGYGHYHETYRRLDGRWKIDSITLTRLRVETS